MFERRHCVHSVQILQLLLRIKTSAGCRRTLFLKSDRNPYLQQLPPCLLPWTPFCAWCHGMGFNVQLSMQVTSVVWAVHVTVCRQTCAIIWIAKQKKSKKKKDKPELSIKACSVIVVILLFISTFWVSVRHGTHVIFRAGCGCTCDNDVSAGIFCSQQGTWGYCSAILDESCQCFVLPERVPH